MRAASSNGHRKYQEGKPQKPVRSAIFVGSLCITVVCALILIWLILRGLPTEEFWYWPHLLMLLVFSVVVMASLAVTEIIPWGSTSLRDWQRPKVLGSFVGLVMAAVSGTAGLSALFNPPGATEKSVAAIRSQLEGAGIVRGSESQVERGIRGIWGEPGCAVTYALSLDNGLLQIVSRKSVSGQAALRMELRAEPGAGARLVASVVMPLAERGDMHEFLYEKAGSREFLTWGMKKRETALRLDRCLQD